MPNVGLKLAFQVINQYERSGKEFGYSSLYTNIFGDALNLGGILACMLAYSIIYIPIAWYIERIFPGEYGAPLPFYFPFMVIL
jgi:ATP-binding cassette subfamily A (ABC1) protein 3